MDINESEIIVYPVYNTTPCLLIYIGDEGFGRSIDCLFNVENSGLTENSLLMLQLINRTDIGSEFKCALQLTDQTVYSSIPNIYYEFDAAITKTGIEVSVDQVINCAIDFVTTGEIKILIGEPNGYILKEDTDRLRLQQNLDFLMSEVTD